MNLMNVLKWSLNFFELLSCVVGFIYFKKVKNTIWKWFPFYLGLVIITEIISKFSQELFPLKLNSLIYRYWGIPIQFLFFYFLLLKQNSTTRNNKWLILTYLVYVFSWFADTFYFSKTKNSFSSFSYTIGNIFLVILVLRFFIKLINSNEIISFKTSMMFWVSTGLLIFYLLTLPFYGLRNTLYYNYREVFYVYNYIQLILDCLMYIFFTIALIWGKPN